MTSRSARRIRTYELGAVTVVCFGAGRAARAPPCCRDAKAAGATWNIVGARREQTNQAGLDTVVAGVRALAADLLAVQEVDWQLAHSGRTDQPAVIAQA